MVHEWRPRRLTPQQLEERRLAAARLLRAGRRSQAEIARRLGVSDATVSRWRAHLTTHGPAGLRRRAHTGRRSRLTEANWTRLGALLRAGPRAAGFETEQWTLRRVAALIHREFGVRYHFRSLGRALHAHGFSPQRPVPRAAERDEALVRAWLRRDWPAVKKKLAASGTPLPSWTRRVTRFGPASG
jgi:transposase